MAIETERRFLLANDDWQQEISSYTHIRQGYLSNDRERTVRIRTVYDPQDVTNNTAVITIKGSKSNGSGLEFEYDIPIDDAEQVLGLCKSPIVEKTRYIIKLPTTIKITQYLGISRIFPYWEIDRFYGDNEGLFIAEIELENITDDIVIPTWIGREITNNMQYANSNLSKYPYKDWKTTHDD
jgi:adenylate cyclase